eukprot:TRINITY_DN5992_c0_g1_i2.p1 TRINITY_DN5992_c0_g1~~TRINITY_DN5992_c0_g1_i2.p1  ORF type:complete len:469 (+),score=99.71 TRINITY_DN5992_c0_g1_i2:80-1486(+)
MTGYVMAGGASRAIAGEAGSALLVQAEAADARAQEAWRQVSETQMIASASEKEAARQANMMFYQMERNFGGQVARLEIRLQESRKSAEAYKSLSGQRLADLQSKEELISQLERSQSHLQSQLRDSENARARSTAQAEADLQELKLKLEAKDEEIEALQRKNVELCQDKLGLKNDLEGFRQDLSALQENHENHLQIHAQLKDRHSKAKERQETVEKLTQQNNFLRQQLRAAKRGQPTSGPSASPSSRRPGSRSPNPNQTPSPSGNDDANAMRDANSQLQQQLAKLKEILEDVAPWTLQSLEPSPSIQRPSPASGTQKAMPQKGRSVSPMPRKEGTVARTRSVSPMNGRKGTEEKAAPPTPSTTLDPSPSLDSEVVPAPPFYTFGSLSISTSGVELPSSSALKSMGKSSIPAPLSPAAARMLSKASEATQAALGPSGSSLPVSPKVERDLSPSGYRRNSLSRLRLGQARS